MKHHYKVRCWTIVPWDEIDCIFREIGFSPNPVPMIATCRDHSMALLAAFALNKMYGGYAYIEKAKGEYVHREGK